MINWIIRIFNYINTFTFEMSSHLFYKGQFTLQRKAGFVGSARYQSLCRSALVLIVWRCSNGVCRSLDVWEVTYLTESDSCLSVQCELAFYHFNGVVAIWLFKSQHNQNTLLFLLPKRKMAITNSFVMSYSLKKQNKKHHLWPTCF